MKYTILPILLLFGLNSVFGQLAMRGTAEFEGTTADGVVGSAFDVTNNGADLAQFYWDIVKPDALPEEWKFTVCDVVLCYDEGVEGLDCDNPAAMNVISPGATITYYKVSLNPYGVAGTHTIQYRLTSTCGDVVPEDVIAVKEITYVVAASSSTKEITDSGIVVYPNPATDRFQINEDEGVSTVGVYNIIGREVYRNAHISGKSHDIANLDKGIYLVKMLDYAGDEIKVLRLIKS